MFEEDKLIFKIQIFNFGHNFFVNLKKMESLRFSS